MTKRSYNSFHGASLSRTGPANNLAAKVRREVMRILQVIHDRERGGVQTLAATIGQALIQQRVTMETAYLYPCASTPALAKLAYALRMARIIWRGGYDTLIAYQSTASILVGIVGTLAGCRLRVVHQTCTPSEAPLPLRLMDRLAGTLGFYSSNIINSATTWAAFARYPARYRRAMILIEYGVDVPVATYSREETRARFALPASAPVLLNVDRLAAQKNQDTLIRALACLPQAHLVIAGDGPQHETFHDLAGTLGVDGRLHMLGAVPEADVADLYAAADLFVFPSNLETFGFGAVEAAVTGLPMVVADLPVLREVLCAGGAEPVSFVAPFDVEGWISAIKKALAAASAVRRHLAFARTIGRKYSCQRMTASYISLFEAQQRLVQADVSGLQPIVEKARS
jgi:glycosyltransferase involved in cell wall biosynthesis